ncbi:hypothetical protein KSP40_PGU004405 [Platanthera guangdongensis]|uniref:Uncharacterized protein n=1 Tax=Platanthera guangdongensis TaxID=2320717 RepID=A0ABR2MAC9_9ASPA
MPDHEDPFCDALVIKIAIKNFTVSRILVDNGSSINVVFKKAFDAMKIEAKRLLASDGPLFGERISALPPRAGGGGGE